ncbi:MAG: agmatine deiminase family protein [Bacteroidota bacterium]
MKRSLLFLIIAIQCFFVMAQQSQAPYEFQAKYHMLDSAELYVMPYSTKAFTQTAPPTGTIRPIAEWEQAQAVLISYAGGFGIPYTLIKEMALNCKVITLVSSSSQQTTVTNNYTAQGINLANCLFNITPVDSWWTRDYGPWFIMTNNNTIAVVDFPYNRPSRPNDDNVPVVMANYLSEPLYGMNVMHTGGNFMNDGYHVAEMTDLVTDENTSLTAAQIDTAFKQYMGVTNCYISTDPLGQYIKHVDCWGKFLDVDKILVASVPTSNTQYNAYEAMATYWANQTSSYGNHYQVYRTYEPSAEPYSNSFILNNKVFVPIMGGTHATADNNAIAVYQHAMPGYSVFGYTALSSAIWYDTDALHCRTHEIADKGMLYIYHLPLLGQKPLQSNYTVNANVYALSGSNLVTDSMFVKYRVNHGAWLQTLMTHPSGNLWTANIPATAPVGGDTIEYYVHASDLSPRSTTHPLIGAPDPHKFWVATTTSVIEENASSKVLLFPNPAVDFIFIQPQDENSGEISVRILNSLGAEVSLLRNVSIGKRMLQIPVSDLPCGTYFVQVSCGNSISTHKVMIMH